MTSLNFTSIVFSNMRRVIAAFFPAFLLLTCFTLAVRAQQTFPLEPDKPVERTLKGGETHSYQIKLKTGQYIHAGVEQQVSFDLIVSLYGPDGKLLVDMNAASGFLWREDVSCVAESEGVYRIEVKTVSQSALAGSYTITMSKARKPNELDLKRAAAERAFSEGRKIYLQMGNNAAAAIKHYEQAAALWAQVGDRYWEAVTRTNIGWAQNDLSQNDESLKSLNQALSMFQEIKDRIGEGKALNGLGNVYKDFNQFDKAKDSYEKALAIRLETKDRRGEATTLNNIAGVFQNSGQLEKARDRFEQALVIYRELKNRDNEADTLSNLAGLYDAQGNFQKAREDYEAAISIARELHRRGSESLYLIALGGVYNFGLNQYEKARDYFEQGLTASRDSKRRGLEALALTGLGLVSHNLNQSEKAIEFYEKALAITREEKDYITESLTLSALGSTKIRLKQFEQARDYYVDYLNLAQQRKNRNNEGFALSSLGNVYSSLNQFEKSRDYYEKAIEVLHETGNRESESLALSGLGFALYNLNEFEKAVKYFNQGLSISHDIKKRDYENLMLLGLGSAHNRLSQYDQAKTDYEQSLIINRELKNRRGEADTLSSLGNVYSELSEYEKAREYQTQALTIFRDIKDKSGESNALINLGNVEYYMAHYEMAQAFYEQALAIKLEANEKQGKDVALNNLGAVSNDLNQYERAKGFFDQASVVSREIRNRVTEGLTMRNVGTVYLNDRSQYEKAKGFYEQALATSREIKDKKGEGGALDSLGTVSRNLGQFEAARDYYEQALTIFRKIKNRGAEAVVLNNLGALYNSLSQFDKARTYLQQALVIQREIKDRRGEAATLGNLGLTDKNAHEYEKARAHFSQALAIFREIKIRRGEAESLNNLGDVENRLNQHERARRDLDQALAIFRDIRDWRNEGSALDNLGTVYQSLRQYGKAEQSYLLALTIFREIKDRQDEGDTLKHLMENCKLKGQPYAAVIYGKQAINAFQEIRGNIKRFEQETRQSFLKDKESVYRTLASLLIAQGRLPEARAVLDLLKEEEFAAAIRRTGETDSVPFSPAERKAIETANKVAEIARQFDELFPKRASLGKPDQQRLLKLRSELVLANEEHAKTMAALSSNVKTGKAYTRVLSETKAFHNDLRSLGPGTVALYSVVNKTPEGQTANALIILVTPSLERAYPIDVKDFDQTVLDFQTAVKNPAYDPLPLAQKLYRMIFLQPSGAGRTTLAADLDTYLKDRPDKTLMWSLDGVLRYVPIAALHDGHQYLVEKYRNTVFEEKFKPLLHISPTAHWSAFSLGVSESRQEGGLDFPALSGAGQELKRIIKDQETSSGILPGVIKVNGDFTRETMLEGLLFNPHPVVHISSHFSFQPADFEQSFLLLGKGHLTVQEMSKQTDLFAQVDLLTLSACDTATGQANGKDIEGFAYRMQFLGARAVIASLWPVDDVGTQILMPSFYRLRETDLTKAEAFQRAQLSLLRGDVKEASGVARSSQVVSTGQGDLRLTRYVPDSQRPFAHPYYWAPFILIGNWK